MLWCANWFDSSNAKHRHFKNAFSIHLFWHVCDIWHMGSKCTTPRVGIYCVRKCFSHPYHFLTYKLSMTIMYTNSNISPSKERNFTENGIWKWLFFIVGVNQMEIGLAHFIYHFCDARAENRTTQSKTGFLIFSAVATRFRTNLIPLQSARKVQVQSNTYKNLFRKHEWLLPLLPIDILVLKSNNNKLQFDIYHGNVTLFNTVLKIQNKLISIQIHSHTHVNMLKKMTDLLLRR